MDLSCFKAYDIRGRVPDQLNSDVAERIGRAFVQVTGAKKVAVGYDIRLSSPEITKALVRGLLLAGADVHDIGLCGTEQIYFATDHFDMDGGIMVTASHNPEDYNGMKLVREGSRPISSDTGLLEIKDLVPGDFSDAATAGEYHTLHTMEEYIKHLLGYVELDTLKPLKIVSNAGNGGAGLVIDQLESRLPFEFIKVHHDPDGSFPNGVPNPLLEENRASTVDALKASGADLGIAWDGDYDRCFFFDADGRFIEGYYIVGLLAEYFLKQEPGAKVIHDPRLLWNTLDVAEEFGGVAIESKTGHAFIKERMRKEDAVYGGEMSAHHYFRDFAYCDSGMIPWLVVANLMSAEDKSLAQLIDERAARFPASGEINRTLRDADAVLAMVEQEYVSDAVSVGRTDGLSVEFPEWRFNLRKSNTEPLVRLNVESRGDEKLMREKTAELLAKIDAV